MISKFSRRHFLKSLTVACAAVLTAQGAASRYATYDAAYFDFLRFVTLNQQVKKMVGAEIKSKLPPCPYDMTQDAIAPEFYECQEELGMRFMNIGRRLGMTDDDMRARNKALDAEFDRRYAEDAKKMGDPDRMKLTFAAT